MAKALQCPTCGHRQRLDAVAGVATFRCSQCDRLLKVPANLRGPAAAPPAPPQPETRRPAAKATRPVADPPDRGPHGRDAARPDRSHRTDRPDRGGPVPAPTGAAPLPEAGRRAAPPPPTHGEAGYDGAEPARSRSGAATAVQTPPRPEPLRRQPDPGSARADTPDDDAVGPHWALRLVVWAAALGIGFAGTLLVARQAGYVDFQSATDVIVDEGIGRYRVPASFALGWALTSAVLAHLGIEALARWRSGRGTRSTTTP